MKTTKINVTVIRETPKALLIADAAGRTVWIQRRWFADGMVSSATFEKAVANSAERAADRAEQQAAERAEREFRNSDHAVAVVRETEKAVAAEVVIEFAGCEETKLVWFPKSAIGGADSVAIIPGWMIRAKEEDITNKPAGSDYYARHRFCKGERVRLVRGVQVIEGALV